MQDNRDQVMPVLVPIEPDASVTIRTLNGVLTEQRNADWQVHIRDIEVLRQELTEVRSTYAALLDRAEQAEAMALEENELRNKEAMELDNLKSLLQLIHYRIDDLNSAMGTADRFCVLCPASGYSPVEGVIHSLDCPLAMTRKALEKTFYPIDMNI